MYPVLFSAGGNNQEKVWGNYAKETSFDIKGKCLYLWFLFFLFFSLSLSQIILSSLVSFKMRITHKDILFAARTMSVLISILLIGH